MSKGLLIGRLGLAESRIPHVDRHGLLWLSRGKLYVESGTLRFQTAGDGELPAGDYAIPYQRVSMLFLGPGTSLTHDVFRLLARHGVLLMAVGEGGVKIYTAPPFGQAKSDVARRHVELWANKKSRQKVARKMYAIRFGGILPDRNIEVLRGIEGARVKETYRIVAQRYGIPWRGRRYDRANPLAADIPNQAINHAATFVEAAAHLAVAAVGALPPLGFIHEDASISFVLDIADLYRADLTLPLAFSVASKAMRNPSLNLEREIRYEAAKRFRKEKIIPRMIEQIKSLLEVE